MPFISSKFIPRVSIFFISVFVHTAGFAADLNGYTAIYEEQLPARPQCEVTVSVADTDWSAIENNSGSSVFCLEAGDHSSKGQLNLRSSGTKSARKWLIAKGISRSGHPVKSATNRSTLRNIELSGSWWVLEGITINKRILRTSAIQIFTGANNNVMHKVLIENFGGAGILLRSGANYNVIQNSVIRDSKPEVGLDLNCIELAASPRHTRIVNNELYNCTKSIYMNDVGTKDGTIIENNDMYITKSTYTNCAGKYDVNGVCSVSKALLSMKSGGSAQGIVEVFNNRIWGLRLNDTSICCTANSSGQIVSFSNHPTSDGVSGSSNYVYFHNNIVMDSQSGLIWTREGTHHNSVVGNIIYNIHRFNADPVRNRPSYAIAKRVGNNDEIYLNTIIDADNWINLLAGAQNNEILCNAVISSGARDGSSVHSGTVVDNNAFFATAPFAANDQGKSVIEPLSNIGADEYCVYTKLQTNPQKVCIPHALPSPNSPHSSLCKLPLGSRSGIGVSDALY